MGQGNVRHFNRWSRTYDAFWGQRYFDRIHEAMLDSLATDATRPASVLDVGCGTGRLLRRAHLRWPSAQLVGIDPAKGMIDAARQALPDARFHVASAETVPVEAGSIDLVLCAASLHHWDDVAAGIGEVARVLRPGGRFCFADWTMAGWLSRLLRTGVQTPEGLRACFAQPDLRVLSQRPMLTRSLYVTLGVKASAAASSDPRHLAHSP
jgi:ubiquinone/menaquinone biosynthesis C-methylase UbiE